MRLRLRRRGLLAATAVLALLVVLILLALQPPRARPSVAPRDPAFAAAATARGAFHIHTNRSDGTGSVDDVAAAAARAGLQFVVLTDHGDGRRPPLPPSVRSGVLCLDGVEISTAGGHYIALGLPGTAPYRLGGDPRDVVEDVRRLGGFGVAAHPDSPKPGLRWTAWDAPFDGVEWLNADSEWRDESRGALLRALITYPWRPPETLGALLSHAGRVLDRWDALTRTRRVVALAGVDAHARIGFRDGPDPYGGRVLLRAPSYEASFRTFTIDVELEAPLHGDAARDGVAVLQAIRDGRVYTALDALASPGHVGFEAAIGDRRARMGALLAPTGRAAAEPLEWRASVAAPEGATLRLICDGKIAAEGPAATRLVHRHEPGRFPAACRLEAGWDDRGQRVTWLVTNPIYVRAQDAPVVEGGAGTTAAAAGAATRLPDVFTGVDAWRAEHDPLSTAAWRDAGADALELSYRLRAGGRFSQYAALVTRRAASIAQATQVAFRARADKPMRMSVQLRPLDAAGVDERWTRSVYLDTSPRDVVVRLDDMRSIWPARSGPPRLDRGAEILLVVDTEHTPPGTSGTITLEGMRLERLDRRVRQ